MTATYWMNRLQSLSTNTDYFVTLNSNNEIQRDSVIYNTTYEHPMMTSKSIESQLNLKKLNGVMNTFYCGSYFGNGFHEDGISSSVTIPQYASMPILNSKIGVGHTTHTRKTPIFSALQISFKLSIY